MSRHHSHINSALRILADYEGAQPFPFHLKKHFAVNKQFGSKDRKVVAGLCYAWFRCSYLFDKTPNDSNLLQAFFLANDTAQPLLEALAPEWNQQVAMPATEKLQMLGLRPDHIFPFIAETSVSNADAFQISFLQQPRLFVRIRPGREESVLKKLAESSVTYSHLSGTCIAFPPATKLEDLLLINKEIVVQDLNSQRVFDWFMNTIQLAGKISVWDCCAASGGKSILLHDKLNGGALLTVTDIRASILHNCKQRLQQAGVNIQRAFTADVSRPIDGFDDTFDLVVCDAPCSGSGTWARNPEQLAYYKAEKTEAFSNKQMEICKTAITHVKPGGYFIYITCSVFTLENEGVVEVLKNSNLVELLHSSYLEGYKRAADTMFVAIFRKHRG